MKITYFQNTIKTQLVKDVRIWQIAMQSGLIQKTLVNRVQGRLDFCANNSHGAERREVTGVPLLGFVVTSMATNNAMQGAKVELTARDSAHWLGALVIRALIIARS